MCEFFSAICVREGGQVRWCESDSHEETIRRLGLDDSIADLTKRGWVRVECKPPFEAVRVDEEATLPQWYTRRRATWERQVKTIAEAVAPASKAYLKAVATASKAYDEAVATASKAYDEAVATAIKAYDEAVAKIDGYIACDARDLPPQGERVNSI